MKESFEKTRHVKKINEATKDFLRGQRNVRHQERILSNTKKSFIYNLNVQY